jgi:hypothetical protein
LTDYGNSNIMLADSAPAPVAVPELLTLDGIYAYRGTSQRNKMAANKDKPIDAASDPRPASSSGSFQRMTPLEAGAIFGIIGGTVAGAVLCKSHGMLAEVGGAIGGGIVGLFVGALLVFPISMACALAWILAKIYWEVLTGRRKLPSVSSSTKSHRQRVLMLIAMILIVFSCVMGGIYFAGSDVQRSRVLALAMPAFGLSFIGLFILVATYRRYPARKEDGKNE